MTQLGSDLGHAPTDLQLNPSLQTAANPSQATDTTRLQMLVAPFNAADAKRQQVEWSRHLEVPVEYTNSLGNRLQLLTPGRFNMGNSHDEVNYLLQQLQNQGSDAYTEFSIRSSAPRHYVQLEAPFYISQFETTVADFQLFVAEANYTSTLENLEPGQFNWRKYISQEEPSHQPVCGVSWDDAKAYCEWLSKRESVHYDLPTEAQWEYACRAGNDGRWCFGNDARRLETYAVYGQPNKPRPSPVGTKKPNDFGLYDLHGNVEEWCLDWHRSEFYANSPQANPVADGLATDPASGRVARGGSWYLADWRTRSATRMYDFPTIPTSAKGFRVVITGELKRVTNSVVK